jgi:hypothetical protein
MVCSACPAEIWRATRAETDLAAEAAGWRHQQDGKTPQLSAGAALCPECVGRAAEFQPAPKARNR